MYRRIRLLGVVLLALMLLAAACGSNSKDNKAKGSSTTVPNGPQIKIGIQDFGESAILSEIYKQALQHAGYKVSDQKLGGFRDLEVKAFDNGAINFGPEYAASMLEFLDKQAGKATSRCPCWT